jgi:hypothetical protein
MVLGFPNVLRPVDSQDFSRAGLRCPGNPRTFCGCCRTPDRCGCPPRPTVAFLSAEVVDSGISRVRAAEDSALWFGEGALGLLCLRLRGGGSSFCISSDDRAERGRCGRVWWYDYDLPQRRWRDWLLQQQPGLHSDDSHGEDQSSDQPIHTHTSSAGWTLH